MYFWGTLCSNPENKEALARVKPACFAALRDAEVCFLAMGTTASACVGRRGFATDALSLSFAHQAGVFTPLLAPKVARALRRQFTQWDGCKAMCSVRQADFLGPIVLGEERVARARCRPLHDEHTALQMLKEGTCSYIGGCIVVKKTDTSTAIIPPENILACIEALTSNPKALPHRLTNDPFSQKERFCFGLKTFTYPSHHAVTRAIFGPTNHDFTVGILVLNPVNHSPLACDRKGEQQLVCVLSTVNRIRLDEHVLELPVVYDGLSFLPHTGFLGNLGDTEISTTDGQSAPLSAVLLQRLQSLVDEVARDNNLTEMLLLGCQTPESVSLHIAHMHAVSRQAFDRGCVGQEPCTTSRLRDYLGLMQKTPSAPSNVAPVE